jgi:hypothetical protein
MSDKPPINLDFGPIIIDPGKNEWILKQHEIPGVCDAQGNCFIESSTETEFLKDGKMYYRRVQHVRNPYLGRYDYVDEIRPIQTSRLPGPTNGGLDLDPKDRWILTGSPFPTFRFLAPELNLELRLRLILARAMPKVGPAVGRDILAMLQDPVVIALFVAGVISFILMHTATGPGVIVALILDCISAAVIGYTLGKNAIPFIQGLLRFLELVADAQNAEEIDEAAECLANMISILVITAATIAITIVLKGIFNALKTKGPATAGKPLNEPKPIKRPFYMNPKDPIGPEVPLSRFGGGRLMKIPKVIQAARQAYRESLIDFFTRQEQGFYIVEEADGSTGTVRWKAPGQLDSIKPTDPVSIEGQGLFIEGKKIRGTVHTHPVDATEIHGFGDIKEYTGPSKGDGLLAKELNGLNAKFGGAPLEHYVVSGDSVYQFSDTADHAVVGPRTQVLGQ